MLLAMSVLALYRLRRKMRAEYNFSRCSIMISLAVCAISFVKLQEAYIWKWKILIFARFEWRCIWEDVQIPSRKNREQMLRFQQAIFIMQWLIFFKINILENRVSILYRSIVFLHVWIDHHNELLRQPIHMCFAASGCDFSGWHFYLPGWIKSALVFGAHAC